MNIKTDLLDQVVGEAQVDRRSKSEGPPKSEPAQVPAEDQVELSKEGQSLSRLKDMAMATPDVRSEKVSAIVKQINDGTYIINSRLIAERLIEDNQSE